jgi:thymidylate synthase
MWFLRGDTNIKFLVDNGCHIWDGDAYKNYLKQYEKDKKHGVKYEDNPEHDRPFDRDEFNNWIKNVDKFTKIYGELGPIYGKQWRNWKTVYNSNVSRWEGEGENAIPVFEVINKHDQIANLIHDLKTNPDSRRLMVSAWNVGELDSMVLPPCHYGFQVYTRELSLEERKQIFEDKGYVCDVWPFNGDWHGEYDGFRIPRRAISLMWNQRSVDTFLGLPFNIASYGLLLEIIAKAVNMVPDELIGNLGDVHLYSNHVEQAKEQIGRELSAKERTALGSNGSAKLYDMIKEGDYQTINADTEMHRVCDEYGVPKRTREPFPLPTLNINTEFWPTESGECGVGPLDAQAVFNGFTNDNFCKCLLEEDLQLSNYQAHPHIKAPLSN